MTNRTLRQLAIATALAASTTLTLDTLRTNAQALQARVHTDAQFKAQLRSDPEGTLQALGLPHPFHKVPRADPGPASGTPACGSRLL
jgi:hypothetical protein